MPHESAHETALCIVWGIRHFAHINRYEFSLNKTTLKSRTLHTRANAVYSWQHVIDAKVGNTAVHMRICDTAPENLERLCFGWNLGAAESPFYPQREAWHAKEGGLAHFTHTRLHHNNWCFCHIAGPGIVPMA